MVVHIHLFAYTCSCTLVHIPLYTCSRTLVHIDEIKEFHLYLFAYTCSRALVRVPLFTYTYPCSRSPVLVHLFTYPCSHTPVHVHLFTYPSCTPVAGTRPSVPSAWPGSSLWRSQRFRPVPSASLQGRPTGHHLSGGNTRFPTHERFERTLFIRTKHNMPIFGETTFIKLQNDP